MKSKIKIDYYDQNGDIITNPVEGQKAFSKETQKLYIYTNGEWRLVEGDINLGMNIYDMNKQIISQMDILDEEGYNIARQRLDDLVKLSDQTYYMLLCRDINYYTIFKINVLADNLMRFSEEVIDCVHDIGAIKSVEPVPGDAIEIWAHPVYGDPVVMYLFPYDVGVVECTL